MPVGSGPPLVGCSPWFTWGTGIIWGMGRGPVPPGSETLGGARGGRLAGFEPKSSFLRGLPYREPEVWGGGRGRWGEGLGVQLPPAFPPRSEDAFGVSVLFPGSFDLHRGRQRGAKRRGDGFI